MKQDDFRKSTKAEKLKMPIMEYARQNELEQLKIHKVLFLPLRKRNSDGYGMSAMFVELKGGNWERLNDYDCFKFHIEDTGYNSSIRGDFEYGGVVFFLEHGGKYKDIGEFIKKLGK